MDPGSDSDLSDYEQDMSKQVETAFDISNVDPAILDRGIWKGEHAGARLGSQNGNDKGNIAETDKTEGDWNELQPGTTIPRQWSISPDAAAIAKKLAKEEAIRQKKGLEKKHGKNAHFLDDIVEDRRKPGIPEQLRKVNVTIIKTIYMARALSFPSHSLCQSHKHANTLTHTPASKFTYAYENTHTHIFMHVRKHKPAHVYRYVHVNICMHGYLNVHKNRYVRKCIYNKKNIRIYRCICILVHEYI